MTEQAPTTSIGRDHFQRMLVLCPTHRGLERNGERTLNALRPLGVSIVRSDGISNLTEHRNILAAKAMEFLGTHRDPPYWWVLQLDGDVLLFPEAVRDLIHYAMQLTPLLQIEPGRPNYIRLPTGREIAETAAGDPMLYTPMVSAAYVDRTDPQNVTAVLMPQFEVRHVRPPNEPDASKRVPCFPVLVGLGACLMSAAAYWEHLSNVPYSQPLDPQGKGRPMAFQATGIAAEEGVVQFISEDFWFCRATWLREAGTYLVPVRAGHTVTSVVFPDDGVFDRLRHEATQNARARQQQPAHQSEQPPKA
jgi:hypothetical protein